jgi:hypothetical protein
MTYQEILQSVEKLPISDQLALMEAISHKMRKQLSPSQETNLATLLSTPSLDSLARDLLARPSPPPENILKAGMFQDRMPDLDVQDFAIAE